MSEVAVDFRASCQQEQDGSLTVLVHISGLPDVDSANMVSRWMREIIQQNAHKIGRRDTAPAVQ